MKPIVLSIFLFTGTLTVSAQIPSCDGNRYRDFVFSTFDSVVNVQYGFNTTMNNVPQTLFLDIYHPHEDSVSTRPLIIFMHGGAFFMAINRKQGICVSFLP